MSVINAGVRAPQRPEDGGAAMRAPRNHRILDTVDVRGGRRPEGHVSRTIVCGVDQPDALEAGGNTLRWLANRLKAMLVLVHVAEEPAREAEAVLTTVRMRLGFCSRDDAHLLAGSPVPPVLGVHRE